MGRLSAKLRSIEGGRIGFWCPGCEEMHVIRVGEGGGWGYNGDPERPTFTPSVLVTSGHFAPGWAGPNCWCTYYAEHPEEKPDFVCSRCHTFVTDGRIQFLSDCTHALVGLTIELPNLPGDA
jgi:hypothetical protein